MSGFVRAILWVLLVVAPGGVFLLPLLVGDAVARRKREEKPNGAVAPVAATPVHLASVPGRGDVLAAPLAGH